MFASVTEKSFLRKKYYNKNSLNFKWSLIFTIINQFYYEYVIHNVISSYVN